MFMDKEPKIQQFIGLHRRNLTDGPSSPCHGTAGVHYGAPLDQRFQLYAGHFSNDNHSPACNSLDLFSCFGVTTRGEFLFSRHIVFKNDTKNKKRSVALSVQLDLFNDMSCLPSNVIRIVPESKYAYLDYSLGAICSKSREMRRAVRLLERRNVYFVGQAVQRSEAFIE
jgi:hypothetical protein